jgi:CheY-like chemotaxis protein
MPNLPHLHVLLAEDDEDDVFLISRALKQLDWVSGFTVVPHGEAVVAYLQGTGHYSDRRDHPWPGVLLLDHFMPMLSGLDVLGRIRSDPKFSALPVVLLTSALRQADQALVAGLRAVYCTKVAGLAETAQHVQDAMLKAITAVRGGWFRDMGRLASGNPPVSSGVSWSAPAGVSICTADRASA